MANDTFTGGFSAGDILYEDNHLIAVNKRAGQLVQSDTAGEPGLEEMIKAFIKERDGKPGEVFLGVAHRIDRPVRVMSAPLVAESMRLPYRMAPSIRAALVAWTVSASPSKRFVNVMSVPLVAEMFVSTGQETRTTVGSCRPLMEVLFR